MDVAKVAEIVKLTELEFHKLMRYTEAVASLEAQAELLFNQVKAKVEAARKIREDFSDVLGKKYKNFDKTKQYVPVESELALHPAPSTEPEKK